MIRTWFTLRFLVLNLIFVALPLLIDKTIFMNLFYKKTIKTARLELQEIANLRALALSELQPQKEFLLESLLYFMANKEVEKWNQELRAIALKNPFHEFALLDFDEKVIASSRPEAIGKIFPSIYPKKELLQKKKAMFIRYFHGFDGQTPLPRLHLYVLRVFDQGILLEAIDMTNIVEKILSNTFFTSLNFAILNEKGIVVAASDPSFEGSYFSSISPEIKQEVIASKNLGNIQLAKHKTPMKKIDSLYEFTFNNETQVAYEAEIPYMNLSVMVYTPKSYFFSKVFDQYLLLFTVYIAILILGILAAIIVGVWISKPLKQLSSLMHHASQGKYDQHFKKQPFGFEINSLGSIFNQTLMSLQSNIQKAEDESVKREMYQRELDIGKEVQDNLVQKALPKIKGLEMLVFSEKADFFLIEESGLIALCHVSQRGISSSLYALSIRSLLRTYATFPFDVGKIMTLLNQDFIADIDKSDMRATAFVSFYDSEKRILQYTSCGHVPAIVKRANGTIEVLEETGKRLGESAEEVYQTRHAQLYPGDFVMLCTDGNIDLLSAPPTDEMLIGVMRVEF